MHIKIASMRPTTYVTELKETYFVYFADKLTIFVSVKHIVVSFVFTGLAL